MVLSFYLSFNNYNLSVSGMRQFIGFANYKNIFLDERFWNSVVNTLILVAVAGGLELVFGLGIALLLNKNIKGTEVTKTLIIIPMLMAPVLVAQLWKIMLIPRYGIVNYLLQIFGIVNREIEWLGSTKFLGLTSLILVDLWQWTPFVAIIVFAGLQSLPQSPIEAALVDGASNAQLFRYIYLPLLRPVLVVVIILRGIDIYKMFDTIYVLTEGGPGYATESLSFYIFNVGFKYFDIGYAAALSYFSVIIISVAMTFFTSSIAKQMRGER